MTPFLKIATDLVEECLKDSKVTSAVKMRLAGLIAEKLHEQYKAGMLKAIEIARNEAVDYEDTKHPEDRAYNEALTDVEEVIRIYIAEAEKEEMK